MFRSCRKQNLNVGVEMSVVVVVVAVDVVVVVVDDSVSSPQNVSIYIHSFFISTQTFLQRRNDR